MAKVNSKDGFILHGWMVNELHLQGGELIAFSIVNQFSQSDAGVYTGGPGYIASWMGWTYKTALAHLKSLVRKGLIVEEKGKCEKGDFCNYRTSEKITEGVCKNYRGGTVKNTEGGMKILHTDNNIESNIDSKIRKSIKKSELSLPFSSETFSKAWEELRQTPKWKKKSASACQKCLDKLKSYPEDFALKLIDDAISNDWQGLVYTDTPAVFARWKSITVQDKAPANNYHSKMTFR